MIASCHAELLQRETRLPGLGLVLDPSQFAAVLREHSALEASEHVELDYIRYKPGRRALALMQIIGASGIRRPVVIRACDAHGWSKLTSTMLGSPAPPDSSLLLPEAQCAIDYFPYDQRLKTAAKLFEPARAAKILRRTTGQQKQHDWTLKMLAYKPHRRLVVRASSDAADLVLKCYTQRDLPAALARINQVAQAKIDRCQPVLHGISEHYGVIASQWIEGDTLGSDLARSERWEQLFPCAGELLAQWHSEAERSLPGIRSSHPGFTRASLNQLMQDLAWIMPELRPRLIQILDSLKPYLDELAVGDAIIHGDFYAKQLIVRQNRLHLIDFDEVSRGHRYQDLGTFIGNLYWSALREPVDTQLLAAAIESFVDGYQQGTGKLDLALLHASIAAGIFRCLPHAFRRGLADWPDKLRQMAHWAWQWCPQPNVRRAHTSSSTISEQLAIRDTIPKENPEWLSYLDLDLVNQCWPKRLAWSAALHGTRVVGTKLLRYKAGRRLLVQYTLNSDAGQTLRVLGKARFKKSVDLRLLQLHLDLQTLREVDVCVPKVLGTLPELNLWFQEKIGGELVQPGATAHLHYAVGRALAELHCSSVTIDRSHLVRDELTILNSQFQQWLMPLPQLAAASERLMSDCQELVEELVPVPPRLIHRDFYFDQVIASGSRIALLDFDLASTGAPELDVGNYLAHLEEYGLRDVDKEAECCRAGEEFLAGYRSRRPELMCANVHIWKILSLARLAAISQRIADRASKTAVILRYCQQQLRSGSLH